MALRFALLAALAFLCTHAANTECDTLVTLGTCEKEPETMRQSCPGFCTAKTNSILAQDNEEVHESPKIISVEEAEGEFSDSDEAGKVDKGAPAKKIETDEGKEGVAAKEAFKTNIHASDAAYAKARDEASNNAYETADIENERNGSRGNYFIYAVIMIGALALVATAWTRHRPDLWRGGPDGTLKQEVRYTEEGTIVAPQGLSASPGSIL